ncbi:MAG TPA: VCBS repeat-containing protein [Gammaproteobacteria bacterium]|nr:VCBS repeat-containing protein [Gammaproteobacteria bacterium]
MEEQNTGKPAFNATFGLKSLNGKNGFSTTVTKSPDGNLLDAYSVSGNCDVNGDGLKDVIYGVSNAKDRPNTAVAVVQYGSRGPFNATYDISGISTGNGDKGYSVIWDGRLPNLCPIVSCVGDFNGDGLDDFVVTLPSQRPDYVSGPALIVYGTRKSFGPNFNSTSINGHNGLRVINSSTSPDQSTFAFQVAGVGDINGDGLKDIIFSNGLNAGDGFSVLFGTRETSNSTVDVKFLNGKNGFHIPADGKFNIATACGSAGDFNGDGIGDFFFTFSSSGRSTRHFIVFGQRSPFDPIFNYTRTINGRDGFSMDVSPSRVGPDGGASIPPIASSTRDFNGDRLSDFIFTSKENAYVYYGTRQPLNATVDYHSIDGKNGVVLTGSPSSDFSNFLTVSGGGNYNGNGLTGVMIGTPYSGEGFAPAGACSVVFGDRELQSPFNVTSSLNGHNGFNTPGITPGGLLCNYMTNAGDYNGDGVDDMVFLAPDEQDAKPGSFGSYMLFGSLPGQNPSSSAKPDESSVVSYPAQRGVGFSRGLPSTRAPESEWDLRMVFTFVGTALSLLAVLSLFATVYWRRRSRYTEHAETTEQKDWSQVSGAAALPPASNKATETLTEVQRPSSPMRR